MLLNSSAAEDVHVVEQTVKHRSDGLSAGDSITRAGPFLARRKGCKHHERHYLLTVIADRPRLPDTPVAPGRCS